MATRLTRSLVIVALAMPSVLGRALPAARATTAEAERRGKNLNRLSGVSLSGACACSVTHCLVLPLDVIKTRMQIDAAASGKGMVAVAGSIFREAPGNGLVRIAAFFSGLPPTAVGYFLQGATKFGGYEFFKQQWYGKLRERGGDALVQQMQLPVMLMSAATAELGATVLLAPMEVLKLRLQTDAAAVSAGVLRTFASIARDEGAQAFYAGLAPIAMRQLPYTVTKLVAYEICRRVADRAISHAGDDLSWLRPYAIVGAGLVAGAAAAVASHPADLLLTRLCGSAVAPCECVIASGVLDQVKYVMSLGFGMYAGLGPRLVMTSAMTSVQFSIYESVRHALGVSNKPPDAVVAPA